MFKSRASLISLLTFICVSLVSVSVFAKVKAIEAGFEKLDISSKKLKTKNDHKFATIEVTLKYTLKGPDWDRFRSYKIKPTLSMTGADRGQTIKSVKLDKKTGKVVFTTKKKVPKTVFVRVGGKGPRATIKKTVFGKQKNDWIKIKVSRDQVSYSGVSTKPPEKAEAAVDLDSILASCKTRGLDKRKCLKLANSVGEKKSTKIFKACAKNTRQTRQFAKCAALSGQLNVASKDELISIIDACGVASSKGRLDNDRCLKLASNLPHPSKLIQFCASNTNQKTGFKYCIKGGEKLGNINKVGPACKNAVRNSKALGKCLTLSKGLKKPKAIIEQCKKVAASEREVLKCIQKGGPFGKGR